MRVWREKPLRANATSLAADGLVLSGRIETKAVPPTSTTLVVALEQLLSCVEYLRPINSGGTIPVVRDEIGGIAHDVSSRGLYRLDFELRNPNGLSWQPESEELWVVVNKRDEIRSDLVPNYMTPAAGRPVGVAIGCDGALLIADDVGNRVWRMAPADKR